MTGRVEIRLEVSKVIDLKARKAVGCWIGGMAGCTLIGLEVHTVAGYFVQWLGDGWL